MAQQVFNRTETKYVLTPAKYHALMEIIEPYLKKDLYFKGTNCSIYFDTPNHYLAIHSLESPLYKEKVRVRSYGVPDLQDIVFLEIKKKFNGVGSKRRIPIVLEQFYQYLDDNFIADTNFSADDKSIIQSNTFSNAQIQAEVDYLFKYYRLVPTLFLAYDRLAYHDKDNPAFRVTFDSNIRSRTTDLRLDSGDYGTKYFQHGEIVMEVKAMNSYPFWFVQALGRLQIYPAKFSKYGRIMKQLDTIKL